VSIFTEHTSMIPAVSVVITEFVQRAAAAIQERVQERLDTVDETVIMTLSPLFQIQVPIVG
jgi:hypothetical protein